MNNKGSISVTKDGGAHNFVYKNNYQNTTTEKVRPSILNNGLKDILITERPTNPQGKLPPLLDKDGCLPISPTTVYGPTESDNVITDTHTIVSQNHQNLSQTPGQGQIEDQVVLFKQDVINKTNALNSEWVKANENFVVGDILEIEMESAKLKDSMKIDMAPSSDLTDHLADFVFTSSLPQCDNKQDYTNYLEILDRSEHMPPGSSFPNTSATWSSEIQMTKPTSNDEEKIVNCLQPNYLIGQYNTDDSALLNFSEKLNENVHDTNCGYSHEGTQTAFQTSNNSNITASNQSNMTTSVPFITPSSRIGLLNHDHETIVSDLNLSHIPNFLGLDTSYGSIPKSNQEVSNNPAANILSIVGSNICSLSDNNALSLNDQSNSNDLNIISDLKHEFNDAPENVIRISINPNTEDEQATKILINSLEGQQQMFFINSGDIHQIQNNSNDQHFIIINNAQNEGHVLTPSDLEASGSIIQQAETISITQNLSQVEETKRNSLISTTLPGWPCYLVAPLEVVENTADHANAVSASSGSIVLGDQKLPPKKILPCPEPGCTKTFKKSSKLKVHMMMHTGERPFKCDVLGCEWAFTTSNKLKRHIESHDGRKDFVCDKPGCNHRFTTVYNLNTHKRLHERPCTEVCTQDGCQQSFPTKRQLDNHLRMVHKIEENSYKCPEPGCDKVFFSSSSMGSHMRLHKKNPDELICKHPGCGKQFTNPCRLRQHMLLHTGERPYVCNYEGCTWTFTTSSKLKRHQTKHTGYRRYPCHLCHKSFQRAEHLKGHLIVHTGSKPFVCPVNGCGNSFNAKSSLFVHLKKHDESGKTIVYHCPMDECANFYANKVSLRQHILAKHCSRPKKGKGKNNNDHVMSSWLSLLAGGEDAYDDDVDQPVIASTPDLLDTDFLAEDMPETPSSVVDPTSSSDGPQGQSVSLGNVPADISPNISSHPAVPVASTSLALPSSGSIQQTDQFQEKQILLQGLQLMEEQQFLQLSYSQQKECMSQVAVERGKTTQIVLENAHGSARTDSQSNGTVSQRALQRWQKQKEEEAAKLLQQLEEQSTRAQQAAMLPLQPPAMVVASNCVIPASSPSSSASAMLMNGHVSGDYKSPVSNNVSLGDRVGQHQYFVVSRSDGNTVTSVKEISDLELEGEGLADMLDTDDDCQDSFMSQLFVRDPETGITFRQTQLLQDDPPNHNLLQEIADMDALNDVSFFNE